MTRIEDMSEGERQSWITLLRGCFNLVLTKDDGGSVASPCLHKYG